MMLVYDSAYPFAVRTTNASRSPADEMVMQFRECIVRTTELRLSLVHGIDIPVHLSRSMSTPCTKLVDLYHNSSPDHSVDDFN